jgi:Flp pilus assembly protein TadD
MPCWCWKLPPRPSPATGSWHWSAGCWRSSWAIPPPPSRTCARRTTPRRPTALASRGKQAEAQAQFAKALALAPDHPSVLNNLALSYALDGKTAEAEKLLRKATALKVMTDGNRLEQNLALVLGLSGKYAEARTAAQGSSRRPAAARLSPRRAAFQQVAATTGAGRLN